MYMYIYKYLFFFQKSFFLPVFIIVKNKFFYYNYNNIGMDLLINLADTREKFDIDISKNIQNILNTAIDINNLLEKTQEMIINYTNDDLICMNDITIERIDNIANLFINEFEDFCINLMMIDENIIDLFVMNELRDIFINQELSILRLDSLLSNDMNIYIKNMKNDINREANKILNKYNVIEKINNYIQKTEDFELKKYMDEIINNVFPSNYINIQPTDYNIKNLIEFIKEKYNNVQITKNADNFFKWHNDVILYEISNILNNKKIYVYVDNKERDDKTQIQDILDIDISKIFCIINNENTNNYVCRLIEKYLL